MATVNDAMKLQWTLSLLLFVATLAACLPRLSSAVEPVHQSQAEGVLMGSVLKGPLTPHEPAHAPERSRVADARIDITTADHKPVTSVLSDAFGNFKVNLPPGKYQITMHAVHGARPRNMPVTVTIAAGEEKRLDIFLDTGLR
jgi:hypothetical protein